MEFSKSFGYAVRGVLYIAMIAEQKKKVQLDEISAELGIPKPFLAKVMKNLVKEAVLNSLKGPFGGFSLNDKTLQTSLYRLIEITGEPKEFSKCMLNFRKCNAKNPCPLHHQFESLKMQWQRLLSSTTIGDLLKKDQPGFIQSITSI